MSASASLLVLSASVRAASLDLCADEYLLMLARPGEVVSVSRVGRDPRDSSVAPLAAKLPGNDGTVESLLATSPRLLVTTGGGGRATALLTRRLGMRTLTLPYPATIDDVAANMRRMAAALGDPRRAEPWLARLASLSRRAPRIVDTALLSGGGQSLSSSSLGAQWMRMAGFRQRPLAEGRVTLEQLAMAPPAVLLISDYRAGDVSLGRRWLQHPLVRKAPSRRVATDGRPWTCAGPAMLGEMERLQAVRR